ncbi:MAG: TspO/MBR family protein [Pseudomonadota bacterium]
MEFVALIGIGTATMTAAATGALFGPGEWYRGLDKPGWTPPDWVFPVTWTVLYILMVWSGYRVATSDADLAPAALGVFAAQITLNAIWSPVFFGLHKMGVAMAVLVGLWIAVAAQMALYWLIDPPSGLMTLPYLVWVTIAGALNLSVWRRNPAAVAA